MPVTEEVHIPAREARNKRRAPRIQIRGPLQCRLYAVMDAQIVDLSVGGAQMEHLVPIRPGGSCELVLREEREELRLACRALRSVIVHGKGATAAREIRYRTGLEFIGITPPQQTFLDALIRRHRGAAPLRAAPDVTVVFTP
jgi:hypothetical protein